MTYTMMGTASSTPSQGQIRTGQLWNVRSSQGDENPLMTLAVQASIAILPFVAITGLLPSCNNIDANTENSSSPEGRTETLLLHERKLLRKRQSRNSYLRSANKKFEQITRKFDHLLRIRDS